MNSADKNERVKRVIERLNGIPKVGEPYPKGMWFYVPPSCGPNIQTQWYQSDGQYFRESDELTEYEANLQGIYRAP